MVGGCGAEARGERRSGSGGELVGVDAQSETFVPGGPQDACRLVLVECAVIAEHVAPLRERCALVEHLTGDERDVTTAVACVFIGYDVRSEDTSPPLHTVPRSAASALRLLS